MNIYISNLDSNLNDQDLLDLFQPSAPRTSHKGSYKVGNGPMNIYKFRKN